MDISGDRCPSDSSPGTRVQLTLLDRAIYSTIAYRDVFDFPPSLGEIHRYLHAVAASQSEVQAALLSEPLATLLATDGTFFALRNRTHILGVRLERQSFLAPFWPLALTYARLLSSLPHVRMVGITGSLAARNVRPGCDIDFIILTDIGAMWRTRALAMVLALFDRKFGHGKLCPNYFLSAAAPRLQRQTLYDAQELTQMIPLFGRDAYEELRRANDWTASFLPNAWGAPTEDYYFDRPRFLRTKACIEWASNSAIGRMLENFEATRKIHRFNETPRFEGLTKSTREAQGVMESTRLGIESAWRRQIEALDSLT